MQNAVIFDIDGTLANCEHRRHHVSGTNKNWPAFFADIHLDKPISNVVRLCQAINNGYEERVILVTGRGEEYRAETELWLTDNYIDYHALLMRPAKDYRPDVDIKREIYEQLKPNFNIKLVLDDRSSVVKMWRSLGLECWQVANGDF